MSTSSERLTALITALSGPSIDPNDIAWTSELSSGRSVLDWLASQLVEDVEWDSQLDLSLKRRAAATRIGLEREELTDGSPYSPLLPSRAKKQAEAINQEAQLLDDEVERLKQRLAQSRIATQRTKERIRFFRDHVRQESVANAERRGRLEELSIQADDAIISAADRTKQTLSVVNDSNQAVDESLKALSSKRQAAISQYASHHQHLIKNTNIPDESRVLAEIERRSTSKVDPELFISALIESRSQRGSRLSKDGVLNLVSSMPPTSDVSVLLSSVWMEDQEALMLEHAECLDKTCAQFRDIIAPLETLHTQLHAHHEHTREIEALCGALALELEDVVDSNETTSHTAAANTHSGLEPQLRELIKGLKDLRSDRDPPLVLLDSKDTLDELRHIVKTAGLWESISTPNVAMDPECTQVVFANSELNTSPPFAPSKALNDLNDQAKEGERSLKMDVMGLEKLLAASW